MQDLAKKAYDDQLTLLRKVGLSENHASTTLASLARLGTNGANQGNIHAELLIWFGSPCTPPCFKAKINVMVQKPNRKNRFMPSLQEVTIPFLLPHLMLHFLFNQFRQIFTDIFWVAPLIVWKTSSKQLLKDVTHGSDFIQCAENKLDEKSHPYIITC